MTTENTSSRIARQLLADRDPAPSQYAGGRGSQIRQAIADLREHVRRGDEALAGQARRTLNDLCASADGYPEGVRRELQSRDLRSTP